MSSKKGSLELSINSIVIIIIAITMLGLGLAFMKNVFQGQIDIFSGVTQNVKTGMMQTFSDGTTRVSVYNVEMQIKKGETKPNYIGIKNVLNGPATFNLDANYVCTKLDQGNCDTLRINYFKTREIASGDVYIDTVNVKADSGTVADTYQIDIKVHGSVTPPPAGSPLVQPPEVWENETVTFNVVVN